MRCAVLPDALLQPVRSLTHLERSSAAASSRSGHLCLGDYELAEARVCVWLPLSTHQKRS